MPDGRPTFSELLEGNQNKNPGDGGAPPVIPPPFTSPPFTLPRMPVPQIPQPAPREIWVSPPTTTPETKPAGKNEAKPPEKPVEGYVEKPGPGAERAGAYLKLLEAAFPIIDKDKSSTLSTLELRAANLTAEQAEAAKYALEHFNEMTELATRDLPSGLDKDTSKVWKWDNAWFNPASQTAKQLLGDEKPDDVVSLKDLQVGQRILADPTGLTDEIARTRAAEQKSGWFDMGMAAVAVAGLGLLWYLEKRSGGTGNKLLNRRTITLGASYGGKFAIDGLIALNAQNTDKLEEEIAARRKWLSS